MEEKITKIIKKTALICVIVIPIMWGIYLILKYGSDTLMSDEYAFIYNQRDIENGAFPLECFIRPSNAHVMLFPKMLAYAVGNLTHYNSTAFLFITCFFAALTHIVYTKYTMEKYGKENYVSALWVSLVLGFICYNGSQNVNLLWGFQTAWYMILFCSAASVYCFQKFYLTGKQKYFTAVLIFTTIGSYSSAHGLWIWLALDFIIVVSLFEKILPKKDLAIFAGVQLTEFVIYYIIYKSYTGDNAFKSDIINSINYYLKSMGNVVVILTKEKDERTGWVFGCVLLALSVMIIFNGIKKKMIVKNVLPTYLIVYGHLFCMSIAFGRSGLREEYFASRYLTPSLSIMAGIILWCMELLKETDLKTGAWKKFVFQCFIGAYIANNFWMSADYDSFKNMSLNLKNTLPCYEILDTSKCLRILSVPIDIDATIYCKEKGLNIFHDFEEETYRSITEKSGGAKKFYSSSIDTVEITDALFVIKGWAFCSEKDMLFDKLYLVIEDRLFEMPYTVDRTGVAEVYGNDSILSCGFDLALYNIYRDECYNNMKLLGICQGEAYEYDIVLS